MLSFLAKFHLRIISRVLFPTSSRQFASCYFGLFTIHVNMQVLVPIAHDKLRNITRSLSRIKGLEIMSNMKKIQKFEKRAKAKEEFLVLGELVAN